MSTCEDCGEQINHRPMTKGVWGGDWISSCSICGWHSEDEVDRRIILNPSKEQIISQKKMLNELYDLVYDLKWSRGQWTLANSINFDEVLDKIYEIKNSMIMEVDEE